MITGPSKSLFKNSFDSFWTSVVSIIVNFLIGVFLARLLGPEGKGGYDLFAATGELLIMALGFSLPSGIIYVIALSSASIHKMMRWLILVALAQGLFIIPLLGIAEQGEFIWTFFPNI